MGLSRSFKSNDFDSLIDDKLSIALLGNPNVGKSTLFNLLTGLNQHTGNWPGKTVGNACGLFRYKDNIYNVIDLPGTYSLNGYSKEEIIASDFLLNNTCDIVIVIIDATSLLKGINLVLDTVTKVDNVIVCVNLIDEAQRNKIVIDYDKLELFLGVPVIPISARKKVGIKRLKDFIIGFSGNKKREIVDTYSLSKDIFNACVSNNCYDPITLKIDKVVTSRGYGVLIMLLLLGIILWITIIGANYISDYLNKFLFYILSCFNNFLCHIGLNEMIIDFIINGIFKTVFWVVSVMLPPMAIFFPLFSLLEDSGYLPRIAFNLDKVFNKCGSQGRQVLTMCMGYGCNACGVMGCRIIKDKKERLISIITNCFSPCNGRFPTIIAMISIFITYGISNKFVNSFLSSLMLLFFILVSIIMTFIVSEILSCTILKSNNSTFSIEMPPYRRPEVLKTIIRSVIDRTLFVLIRSICVSIPAGVIIWICSNIYINGVSILNICSNFLEPFGKFIGLDGVIILAFILGLPANEIVIPIIIMAYLSTGNITGYTSIYELRNILISNGWTIVTAFCFIFFTIFHFPCGTTILTIKKETNSLWWTIISIIIPTLVGIICCFILSNLLNIIF